MAEKKKLKSDFTPEQLAIIQNMAGYRVPAERMAAILGMGKTRFNECMKLIPEVAEAIEKGKGKATGKVLETAYKMATSGKSSDMTKFWLSAFEGIKAPDRLELTGRDGEPLTVTELTPAQRRAEIERIYARKRRRGETT